MTISVSIKNLVYFAGGMVVGFVLCHKKRDIRVPKKYVCQTTTCTTYTPCRPDEIIFSTRGDAETVITTLQDIIDYYDFASLADFKDIVGITVNYTDNFTGWRDLSEAISCKVKDGYVIKFPKLISIK